MSRLTETEARERYGRDAREWLSRWDAGQTVWSVEMGGLGPDYEQSIQIATAEIVRHLLDVAYDASEWSDPEKAGRDRKAIEHAMRGDPVLSALSLSEQQFTAADSLACVIYRRGPASAFRDKEIKGRLIQVRRDGEHATAVSTIFGQMFRLWRTAHGRSLRDVEVETGVSHATLSRIERGNPMDIETWLRLQRWMFERRPGPQA